MSRTVSISHPHPPFVFKDNAALIAFIHANDFGTLITPDLQTSHIPIVFDASQNILRGHMSVRNSQCDMIQNGSSAKIILWGPHGYVSPNVYDQSDRNVPTWNYQTVEITGTLSAVPQDQYAEVMKTQIEIYEDPKQEASWSLDGFSQKFIDGNFRAIVAFELSITSIVGKNKMSQNKSADERGRIAQKLHATDPALGALIQQTIS